MKQTTLKIAGLALAAAFALTARAEVAIHQNVSVYGYAAGSIQYTKPNGKSSDTEMDLDAAKLGLAFNFAPVTAKLSVYTDAGAKDLYVLEANVTYDIGNGLSVTGGRFQSWIGYEAFDIPNCNFITYGTDEFGAIIPNFHEGLRVDYAFDKMNVGVAIVNSVYNKSQITNINMLTGEIEIATDKYRGDSKLSDGYGVEGHFGYNGGAFSLGATVAFQNDHGDDSFVGVYADGRHIWVGDVWAQYVLNQTTFGAELFYSNTKIRDILNTNFDFKTTDWYGLIMVKQQINEKFSLAGRYSAGQEKYKLSGSSLDEKANFWKISVQPAYAITENLSVGAEVSYTKYGKLAKTEFGKSKLYAGVQAVFKF